MPIVPETVLSPRNIGQTSVEEPFLLTAVLTIATKNRPDLGRLHRDIWTHMQDLILGLVLGRTATRQVGTVEGLLLLAERVPYANFPQGLAPNDKDGYEQIEEYSAWTLVGLAVRQSYLLHLEKYGFQGEHHQEQQATSDRKRLAWTCTSTSASTFPSSLRIFDSRDSHVSIRSPDLSTNGSSVLVSWSSTIHPLDGRRLPSAETKVFRRPRLCFGTTSPHRNYDIIWECP